MQLPEGQQIEIMNWFLFIISPLMKSQEECFFGLCWSWSLFEESQSKYRHKGCANKRVHKWWNNWTKTRDLLVGSRRRPLRTLSSSFWLLVIRKGDSSEAAIFKSNFGMALCFKVQPSRTFLQTLFCNSVSFSSKVHYLYSQIKQRLIYKVPHLQTIAKFLKIYSP